MNWQPWIEQRIPVTPIQRGGATVWPKDANGLIGDSLGPILHLHDDASEIFYFISGRCRLEIGNSEEFFGPGDFVLVPPEVPHNLWNAGDEDLLIFWLVAPNFVNNKWRTDNFPPGVMNLRAVRSQINPGIELPSDDKIRSRLITVAETGLVRRTTDQQEAVIYLVEGEAEVGVGKLSGRLSGHDFVHVPVATTYSVTPLGRAASVLLFEMPGDRE